MGRLDVDLLLEPLELALHRPEVRTVRGRIGHKVERDELKVFLDVDEPVLLLERGPAARGHSQPVARDVQVPQHRARLRGEHLDVAHEVVALPVVVEHLVTHVGEVERAKGRGGWRGMVELAQRAAHADVRAVEHRRLSLQKVLGVHPAVPVLRVGPSEDAW